MILVAVAAGCGKKERPDLGAVKDGVYENRFFGMSLKIPAGWEVQDAEARRKFIERGRAAAAGEQPRVQDMLEEAEQNTLNLLMLFRFPLGSAASYNPGFIVVAEKIADRAPIRNGSDYLVHAKQVMELSRLPYSFGAIDSATIGGKTFGVLDVDVNVGESPVKQKYYATTLKDHALLFILSYKDDEDLRAETEILRSVRFR